MRLCETMAALDAAEAVRAANEGMEIGEIADRIFNEAEKAMREREEIFSTLEGRLFGLPVWTGGPFGYSWHRMLKAKDEKTHVDVYEGKCDSVYFAEGIVFRDGLLSREKFAKKASNLDEAIAQKDAVECFVKENEKLLDYVRHVVEVFAEMERKRNERYSSLAKDICETVKKIEIVVHY